MKITYFGTAAAEGIPALFCYCKTCTEARLRGGKNVRTRSQALIGDSLLIDYPADTYMHALHGGLPLHEIRHCLITHSHQDHLLADEIAMRAGNFATVPPEKDQPFCFYGARASRKKLAETMYDYDLEKNGRAAFCNVYPFQTYEIDGYTVIPLNAIHDALANPYIYAIGKDGKYLLYGNDTDIFPEDTWAYLEKSGIRFDFVSLDCTAGDAPMDYVGHMNLERNIAVRDRMRAIGCADDKTVFCCTHFSHNGGFALHDVFAEAAAKEGFLTAYDGMVYEF